MTPSDVDLVAVFKTAAQSARRIEFINPDQAALDQATRLLEKTLTHYRQLSNWVASEAR
jgi:hypothetical protein